MRKKLLTVGLAVLMAISLTSCKSSEKTQTIKEDTYKNYKTYSFKNNFTYKVPKKWRFEKNSNGTHYHYKDKEDNTKGMLMCTIYNDVSGSVSDVESFTYFLDGIKESTESDISVSEFKIDEINSKRCRYTQKVDSRIYYIDAVVFDCPDGWATVGLMTPKENQYSKAFDNIISSIKLKKESTESSTSEMTTTTEKTTEEPTTTEATTEATTEKTTQIKPKSKDITDKNIDVSTYRNDSTGKWRIATTSDNFDIEKYALSYYLNYFDADDEIHVIVNFTRMTSTKISNLGDTLDVSIHEYTKGEEHDANKALGGMLLNEYHVNIKTGKITKIQ